jgi:hypothetical protein
LSKGTGDTNARTDEQPVAKHGPPAEPGACLQKDS